jgi:tetratricopeptide (TPR) repeat protein
MVRDRDGAIAEFRKAVRLAPDEATYHRELAFALWDAEQLPEAVGAFREALRLRREEAAREASMLPTDWTKIEHRLWEKDQRLFEAEDRAVLSSMLRQQGDLDAARAELAQAVALAADHPNRRQVRALEVKLADVEALIIARAARRLHDALDLAAARGDQRGVAALGGRVEETLARLAAAYAASAAGNEG